MITFKLCISALLISLSSCISKNDDSTQEDSETQITINSDWFDVDQIYSETYSLTEPQSSQYNVSYLIIGSSEAIMFDTGSGENQTVNGFKIKSVLDQITQIPTTLLISHFHFDHNQNISEFNSVGFPDLPFLRQSVTSDDKYDFTSEDLFLGNYPAQVKINKWYPVKTNIDLGNRVIQIINIPGHTNESIAIIDKTNKAAFLGDFLYNGSLFLFDNEDILVYEESVEYLISIVDNNYKLFGAHGTPEIENEKLIKLRDFLGCIKSQSCEATERKVWGYDALVYDYEGMRIIVFQ